MGISEQQDEQVEESVDLDLKADDARLREAIGKPTVVKIDGINVHITHVAEWPTSAMNAAAKGDWEAWSSEVIFDDDERATFIDADLQAYQLNAIFEICGAAGGTTPGKSKRSRRSSGSTRNR